MKFLLFTFWGLLLSAPVFAQSTWHYLPNAPQAGRIDDVFFLNPLLGWAADDSGHILKTTDGGTTWDVSSPKSTYFRCIEFFNENIGYAGTLTANLFRTTDGGQTWTDLAPSIDPKPYAVCGISIVDSLNAYAVGEWDTPGFFLKTTDGGLTWTSHSMGFYAKALVDVFFMSPDTGFVTGQGANGAAVILYTTDGGQSWSKKFDSGISGQYVWKIQRVTPDFWVGSIQTFNGGKFVRSYDGGQTWETLSAPVPDMQGIGFATPTHGWVGGYVNGFYETTDGGENWEFKSFGGNFNRFYFLDSTLAYASGWSIFKFSDTTSSSVQAPIQLKSQNDGFVLHCSPNPMQDFLDVQFHLPRIDNVRIGVYTADGAFVREIYHERMLQPGEHQFRAADLHLSPGLYFLGVQRNHGLYAQPFSKL